MSCSRAEWCRYFGTIEFEKWTILYDKSVRVQNLWSIELDVERHNIINFVYFKFNKQNW